MSKINERLEKMALTSLHVINYCRPTGKVPCRYLQTEYDPKTYASVFLCTKLHPVAYDNLKKKRIGVDESKMGDYCKGYLYLKKAKQGSDVKKS